MPSQAPVVGVWTPWAEVLCVACHDARPGVRRLPISFQVRADQPVEQLPHDHATTPCDGCGRLIVVPGNVAREHNLVLALRSQGIQAYLAQTGGMHSAAVVPLPGGGCLSIVESEKNPGTDPFLFSEYEGSGDARDGCAREVVGFQAALARVRSILQQRRGPATSHAFPLEQGRLP